jgi:hypothetical protein
MRSIWAYLACGAALVSASAAYAVLTLDHARPSSATAASRNHPRVKIAGSVGLLYPGSAGRLKLTLKNRSSQRVTVRRVKARVGDASPSCGRSNLRVPRRRHLKLKIRPGKRRRLAMSATLAASAPDGCQNATFPLRYKAKAKP